jgi:hypothetical protein
MFLRTVDLFYGNYDCILSFEFFYEIYFWDYLKLFILFFIISHKIRFVMSQQCDTWKEKVYFSLSRQKESQIFIINIKHQSTNSFYAKSIK